MGDDTVEWTEAQREELLRLIRVTPSEVAAAKLLITVNEKLGRETDPLVIRLANAKPLRRPRR